MAQRVWEGQGPRTGRLAFVAEHAPGRLRLIETRISASDLWLSGWDEGAAELGVVVVRFALRIDLPAARFGFTTTPIAAVSLHALARRLQRGRDPSEAALLADLAPLAHVGEAVEVAAPGGRWVGVMVETPPDQPDKAERVFAARTFYDHDASGAARRAPALAVP